MRIIRLRELYYACSTIFFREVRCKTGRVVREADPYGGVTRGTVRCRRADRGVRPYGGLHEVRWGGASGTPPPTEALLMVRWGGAMWASAPTESYHGVRRGGALPLPRATARVAPTEGYKRCGGVKNPPVTASPCQPPLGKGAEGTDCHSQCAHWLRNDMVLHGVRYGGAMWASPPTEALQETRRKSWRAG